MYIAASPRNIEIFQTGRIVGRDDDKEHFGLIESVELETDAEDGYRHHLVDVARHGVGGDQVCAARHVAHDDGVE